MSALIRGVLSSVPGMGLVAEFVGMGVLVTGRLDRMRETATGMAQAAGGPERLASSIRSSERLEVLVLDALECAARTALETKRALLGRVVGQAAVDGALIDSAQLITAALGELDAPHIRALARLAEVEDAAYERAVAQDRRRDDEPGRRHYASVSEAVLRAGDQEPEPVRSALIRTGVALPATLPDGGIALYRVSDFGRQILEELQGR